MSAQRQVSAGKEQTATVQRIDGRAGSAEELLLTRFVFRPVETVRCDMNNIAFLAVQCFERLFVGYGG